MKSCLVLGNGRSLKDFDFNNITGDWIGCCLAFRYWDKINKYPDYYVNVDEVVCQNPEVIDFIKKDKCKMYLLSKSIINVWSDFPKDKIIFIEHLMCDPRSIFKYIRNWCSGSASVVLALDLYEDIHIAGFDCDYVEFLPECEKLEDGTLRIKETPKNNPNYFFNDYQRKGDKYNVPNGKKVHLQSWKELSEINRHLSVMFPECKRKITNYNDKKSISEYFETKSLNCLMGQSLTHNEKAKLSCGKTRIAFCVPSTSNKKNWTTLEESYLFSILLPSLEVLSDFNIEVYIGYDHDDELYSKACLPLTHKDIKLKWFSYDSTHKGNPCKIWNNLTKRAIDDGIEYIQIGGDDIMYDGRKEWLGKFIKLLKKYNNVGYSAGFSNNENIPTQFLIHKKHFNHFGWVFPPQIHNWFCDDFLYGLYKHHGNWVKEYKHHNLGGEPRYTPNNDKKLCEMLIKRHRKKLKSLN
jgi:hypothetical protein